MSVSAPGLDADTPPARSNRAIPRLKAAIARQWTAEAELRSLNRPEPISLTWSNTGRPVAAPTVDTLNGLPANSRSSHRLRFSGDLRDVVTKFRQLPSRQLVVLGAPGAGKSVLAILFTLGLLHDPQPPDPVPFLVSVASWNPYQQHLDQWLAAKVLEAHPGLANGDATAATPRPGWYSMAKYFPFSTAWKYHPRCTRGHRHQRRHPPRHRAPAALCRRLDRSAYRHQHYATTAVAWFRVDQEYVTLVDRHLIDNIIDLTDTLQLPRWDDDYLTQHVDGRYGEDRYNRWVSHEHGYALLDRDLYRGRVGERVEICDLLTKNKQLICVERMDGSDKMSHLFQQGSVSAQLLMTNDDYRAKLMTKLHNLDPHAEFGEPSDWIIVYAIGTSKPGHLKQIMYFFSRAALRTHGLAIKGSGIKVALAKIQRCAQCTRLQCRRPTGAPNRRGLMARIDSWSPVLGDHAGQYFRRDAHRVTASPGPGEMSTLRELAARHDG